MNTAFLLPGSVTQGATVAADWAAIGNLLLSDDSRATVSLSVAIPTSETLFLTAFGGAVPESVIDGVEVECEIDTLDADCSLSAQLTVDGSTGFGSVKSTTSSGVVTLGGATDRWGTRILEAQVEPQNFGVLLAASYSGATLGNVAIDRVRLRLHYSGVLESSIVTHMAGTI